MYYIDSGLRSRVRSLRCACVNRLSYVTAQRLTTRVRMRGYAHALERVRECGR